MTEGRTYHPTWQNVVLTITLVFGIAGAGATVYSGLRSDLTADEVNIGAIQARLALDEQQAAANHQEEVQFQTEMRQGVQQILQQLTTWESKNGRR